MDRFEIDLNSLVQETLDLAQENTSKKQNFNICKEIAKEEDYLSEVDTLDSILTPNKDEIPAGPGVLYTIDKGAMTFSINSRVVENIESEVQGDEKYFETEYLELANVIHDQIQGRRFPLSESQYLNISDPCGSWWIVDNENSFTLAFNVLGDQDNGYIELGPLGDVKIAASRFSRLGGCIQELFPLNDVIVSKRKIQFNSERTDEGELNENFVLFKEIFSQGLSPKYLYENISGSFAPTLYFYLHELAGMRRFWVQIEKSLNVSV